MNEDYPIWRVDSAERELEQLRAKFRVLSADYDALESRVKRAEEAIAKMYIDDKKSLDTFGQHLFGSVLRCAELFEAALNGEEDLV